MQSKAPNFIEITPDTWDDAKKIGQQLYKTCVFRGMENKNWGLKTSIERAAEQFSCPPEEIWHREKEILNRFKARAHHFIQAPPSYEDNIEWLSLIQHHGGPTRLLDFTESFYIASFFAVQNAEGDATIWAINRARLTSNLIGLKLAEFEKDKKYSLYDQKITRLAETFIAENKYESLMLAIVPPRLNERLAVQKGLFIFPCDIKNSFVSNLCGTFHFPFNSLESENAQQISTSDIRGIYPLWTAVWKINLPKKLHTQIILDLYSMNIDSASLFPGLDGFAKSLNYSVRQAEPSMQRISSITIYPDQPKSTPPES